MLQNPPPSPQLQVAAAALGAPCLPALRRAATRQCDAPSFQRGSGRQSPQGTRPPCGCAPPSSRQAPGSRTWGGAQAGGWTGRVVGARRAQAGAGGGGGAAWSARACRATRPASLERQALRLGCLNMHPVDGLVGRQRQAVAGTTAAARRTAAHPTSRSPSETIRSACCCTKLSVMSR